MKKGNERKKSLMGALLVGGALIGGVNMLSCTRSSDCVLKGEGIPDEYEGKRVFVGRTDSAVCDTLIVMGGSFSHMLPMDTTVLYQIDVEDNDYGRIFFVAEGGDVVFTPKESGEGFQIRGGRLNSELRTMLKTAAEMDNSQAKEAMLNLKDSTLTDEEKKEVTRRQASEFRAKTKAFYTGYLARNPNNALGMLAFSRLEYKDEDEFLAAYEVQSDVVKQGYAQRTRYEMIHNKRKTQEGMPYCDFDIQTIDGETVKFSEFVEEGKYLLVDFWASWCVPCHKVIPYIKDMVKRFPSERLNVLSIGCYDKPEPYTKAALEEDLPWADILDVDSNGAKLYGVFSIPHFILISPEGIILKRASNILHIEAVLEEHLLNP